MPDMSMCTTKECPSFELCYRAQAKPDELWQSYTPFPLVAGEAKCKWFEPINKGDRLREKKDA